MTPSVDLAGGAPRRLNRLPWLSVLFASVAIQPTLSYALMGLGVPNGFAVGVLVSSAIAVVSIVLWIPYRQEASWTRWDVAFFGAMLAAWSVTMGSSLLNGSVVSLTVVWLPIAVVMIWWKRSDVATVRTAVTVFAWVLIVGMATYLILQAVSLVPHRIPESGILDFESKTYWLPLAEILGMPSRWAGPFGHPNIASPIGAFLIVLGIVQRRWTRAAFIAAGALILILTGTRSSLIAAVAGLGVLFIAQRGWLRPGRTRRIVFASTGALLVLVVVGFLVVKPSLTNRSSMWPQFLAMWDQSPFVGVGDPGVTLAIQAGNLPTWAVHGHNIVIDPLVRYGVPALLLVLAVLVLALVVTLQAAARGGGVGLGILTTVIAGGLTETLLDWRYFNVMTVILLASVLLAASAPETSSSA